MDSFENIIIGTGPAGVSAALKLEGGNTCIIDVPIWRIRFDFILSYGQGLLGM